METKANYVVVGAFTLLAILAAFGFIYWTSGVGERGEMAPLRFHIPGSASGLSRGSAVLFNGVRVGEIERVYLNPSNPSIAIADAMVDRLTPITRSTRADVGLAGLTGQANIELRGGDPSEPNLLDVAEEQDTVAEIVASPSAVSNLLQTAQSLLTRADSVLDELDGFVTEARGPLVETIRNIETFTNALGHNAEGIDAFLASVGNLSDTVARVSGRLDSTLAAAEELITAVDRDRIAKIVENVDGFTQRLNQSSERFETIASGVDEAVQSLGSFSQRANETLARVDRILEEVEPESVGTAVRNFEEASTAINRASTDIARVSETIGARTEDIDRFITEARELASRLNAASVRVDGVLAKVDGLLASGDGESLFAEASETLRAYRQVADTLNARIGTITEGLSRFSDQGLRNMEALVRDARRSISRIERAVSEFEQNPQRIITGGDGTIRQYDGRVRR
jgi:ABC-type transport system involved in resistance to organic solvents, periplasmic component